MIGKFLQTRRGVWVTLLINLAASLANYATIIAGVSFAPDLFHWIAMGIGAVGCALMSQSLTEDNHAAS